MTVNNTSSPSPHYHHSRPYWQCHSWHDGYGLQNPLYPRPYPLRRQPDRRVMF